MPRNEFDDHDEDRDDDRYDERQRRRYDDDDDLDDERRPYQSREERISRGKLLVRIPGVMMILVGLLGIGDKGWALLYLDDSVQQQDDIRKMFGQPPLTPAERDRTRTTTVVMATVGVIGAVIGLIGGLCMVAVVGRGFAITSSVIAVIPLLHGCCFLSTCVGIYSLVMLLNANVKLAFDHQSPKPRRDDQFDDPYDNDRYR